MLSPSCRATPRAHRRISIDALAVFTAVTLTSGDVLAVETLRANGTYATGLRVELCAASGPCQTLVRYPTQPPRSIQAVEVSPSGRHFFVWSTPDRHARELDVYERTNSGVTRVARWSPGFGGELRWVEGDRLWHSWGCGTSCVTGQLYDTQGRTLFSEPAAAALWESADHRFAAIAFHGGAVVVLRFATLRTTRVGASIGARFPIDVVWRGGAVRVRFEAARGAPLRVSAALP